jgi:NitT/TauT family transport system substrate-binding protein
MLTKIDVSNYVERLIRMKSTGFSQRKTILCLVLIFFSCFIVFSQPNKLRFAPQWTPQAQFAGYFVALDKGYYKEAGLNVEILYPNAGQSVLNLLETGKADVVSLFLTTAIRARSENINLINFGQLSQHSATIVVAHKTHGIEKLSDLNGKKIAVWKSGFDELPRWLMLKNNLKIEWIPVLSSINLFLIGGVSAMSVMWYNEYDTIINSGIDPSGLSCFFLSDYGLDIPEDGLYCLESTRNAKGKLLADFLNATLKGWEYARSNQDYAISLVLKLMKDAHIPANEVHQRWMLQKYAIFSPLTVVEVRNRSLSSTYSWPHKVYRQ